MELTNETLNALEEKARLYPNTTIDSETLLTLVAGAREAQCVHTELT